jgi:(1->4)-alpha-D-glucan 1-alpha-D-glucosylmutase
VREEKVTGLRVDHPDGLYDPTKYFQQLQRMSFVELRMAHLSKITSKGASAVDHAEVEKNIHGLYDETLASDPLFKPFYIVGEKILSKGEKIPEDWPVFSTTGYDFLNILNGIFVESENSKAFDAIYARFTRLKHNYHDIVYESKKLIMQASLSSEINTLGHYLDTISEKNRHTRDFTLNSLTAVIMEVVGFFPVYRTYVNSFGVSDKDRQYIELAVYRAKRKNPAINESIFDFLKGVLLLGFPDEFHNQDKKEWLDFVMKFQQVTGPVMAKGLEDTAFYHYNRLVSLNEVGGSPDRFGTPLETFHGQNIERAKKYPYALLASSTHDTKRSEDIRARINVLSEMPDEWKKQLFSWSRINRNKKIIADGKPVPDRNEEYLLYQTILGAWPIGEMDEHSYNVFIRRIENYMIKALREAKVNTSWTNYNTLYEEAVLLFLRRILDRTYDNQFLRKLQDFQKIISCYGMYKSLSQTLLKMTSPGIPDFYQGNEIWGYNLVDPDNRRPVDYDQRIKMLQEIKALEKKLDLPELAGKLMKDKNNGLIKLFIIYKTLNYRKKHKELFEKGEYISLDVEGECSHAICAFSRRIGKRKILVIAPRYVTCFINDPWTFSVKRDFDQTAFLIVPFGHPGERYGNVFTGEVSTIVSHNEASALRLSEIFTVFPVAVLEKIM